MLPGFVSDRVLGAVVTDFSPLREPLQWLEDIKKKLPKDIPLIQVKTCRSSFFTKISGSRQALLSRLNCDFKKNLSTPFPLSAGKAARLWFLSLNRYIVPYWQHISWCASSLRMADFGVFTLVLYLDHSWWKPSAVQLIDGERVLIGCSAFWLFAVSYYCSMLSWLWPRFICCPHCVGAQKRKNMKDNVIDLPLILCVLPFYTCWLDFFVLLFYDLKT